MFAIKNFVKLLLITLIGLFLQIVPAYAAIQTESLNIVSESDEVVQTRERLIETIHSPPRIVLSVENDYTVETFYPEETSFDEIETNNSEEIIDKFDSSLPRITTTLESGIVVETFYPSEYEIRIAEKKTPSAETQTLDDTPAKFSVISLSLDGTNSVQYFERSEPYFTSLDLVVSKSTLSDGIVIRAEFMQSL